LGLQYCKTIVESLADYQVTIVSGMATGIDGCAHSQALESDLPTAGVVAHGLKYRYPMANDRLFDKMEARGMVITEHGYSTFANKDNFPRRNRLVAAMSDATIVVESRKRGGSMITANLAHDYNREVFAVPGRISDRSFEGCNHLIKSHKASLYQSVEDLAYLLNWSGKGDSNSSSGDIKFNDLTEREKKIVSYLRVHQECTIDDLAFHCSIDLGDLSSELLQMEFKGMIKALPGNKYLLLR
jgi:DNA processing protein